MAYTDGDEETLNLKREKWEFIEVESRSDAVSGCLICISMPKLVWMLMDSCCYIMPTGRRK